VAAPTKQELVTLLSWDKSVQRYRWKITDARRSRVAGQLAGRIEKRPNGSDRVRIRINGKAYSQGSISEAILSGISLAPTETTPVAMRLADGLLAESDRAHEILNLILSLDNTQSANWRKAVACAAKILKENLK
jgi:hypothetical protein